MNNKKQQCNKQKKIKKQPKQSNQDPHQVAKNVKFSYEIVKQIDQPTQFYIIGDTVIDIDQLMSHDNVKIITAHNNFRKALSVNRRRNYDMVEVILDTDAHGIIDLSMIVNMLRQTQNEQHFHLAKLIQDYHNLIHKSIDTSQYYIDCSRNLDEDDNIKIECKQEQDSSSFQSEIQSDNIRCEQHGWNYQKSLDRAQQYINDMYNESQNQNWFFSYIIFKGRKYDQIKSVVATSSIIFRDFMCMNEEQVDYLLLRKPILYPQMMVNQFQQQTYRRIFEMIMQFNIQSAHLNGFRQIPTKISSVDFDIKTVDNLKVCFECEGILLVLSEYKNKKDDLLFFYKFKPKGNFKAQDILQSQRNFKKGVKFNPYNSQIFSSSGESSPNSPHTENQDKFTYVDLRYEAQSEIFKEKFYSIIDNDDYHDLNFYL